MRKLVQLLLAFIRIFTEQNKTSAFCCNKNSSKSPVFELIILLTMQGKRHKHQPLLFGFIRIMTHTLRYFPLCYHIRYNFWVKLITVWLINQKVRAIVKVTSVHMSQIFTQTLVTDCLFYFPNTLIYQMPGHFIS